MTDYVKELSKFNSELLAYIINKYAWREQKEIKKKQRRIKWTHQQRFGLCRLWTSW